jgi:hypothetical protein
MNRKYCFFALTALNTAMFFAAHTVADETPAIPAAAKVQPPITVLSSHIEVSRLGYTHFEMKIRANQEILGWEIEIEGHGKIGTCTVIDSPLVKSQTQSWQYTWDTARPIKSAKCSIVSVQVPTGTGNPKQIMLESPITFEAKLFERGPIKGKLDISRLKDPKARTTAEVIAFFEKDGNYNAKENRVYTLKELRSALGEPMNINQGIAEQSPMPEFIPPGFNPARVIAAVNALNADLPRRNLLLGYECRDGIAGADLNQLGYHGDNAIKDTIRLQIHTVQASPTEKQSEKQSPAAKH